MTAASGSPMTPPVFRKTLPLAERWRLDAEADGLARLSSAGAIRVPRVIGQGASGGEAWLEIEWFDLQAADAACDARMGAALARLHRVTGATYGLERDNAIGAAPQTNSSCDDWASFWRERRIGFQLERAASNGRGGRLLERGRRLLELIPAFFAGYRPLPSLLHGDLWAGNRGMLADGTPVIFDPAVYYGDRESDLAMTRLFGGFGTKFYAAYAAEWPLDAGAATRVDLYNLYHALNHLNLFGGGYRAMSEAMIDRLLAATGA